MPDLGTAGGAGRRGREGKYGVRVCFSTREKYSDRHSGVRRFQPFPPSYLRRSPIYPQRGILGGSTTLMESHHRRRFGGCSTKRDHRDSALGSGRVVSTNHRLHESPPPLNMQPMILPRFSMPKLGKRRAAKTGLHRSPDAPVVFCPPSLLPREQKMERKMGNPIPHQ